MAEVEDSAALATSGNPNGDAIQYVSGFLRGVVDSLQIPLFLSYCLRSEGVWLPTAKCMVMNIVLVATIAMFATAAKGTGLEWVIVVSWQIPLRIITDVFGFYGWSLYPSMFYAAQAEKHRRRKMEPRRIIHSPSYVGEKALRSLMQLVATLLRLSLMWLPTMLIGLVQNIGLPDLLVLVLTTGVLAAEWLVVMPAVFIMDSISYSFFCFESRLEQQGSFDRASGAVRTFRLSVMLALFESAWPYYAGYGFVQHVGQKILVLSGYPLLASCFYAAIMPVNVVTALDSSPGPKVLWRLPIFSSISLYLGKRIAALAGPGVFRATPT